MLDGHFIYYFVIVTLLSALGLSGLLPMAQEILQDIRSRELNDPERNLAEARYDLRQAERFAQGLGKGIEMD